MEQGPIGSLTNTITTPNNSIENIDSITANVNYVITRNDENEITVQPIESNISNLSVVTRENEYIITRDNNDNVVVTESAERINDLENIQQNSEWIITRNNNQELRVAVGQERINGLGSIQNGRNYQLTRNALSNLEITNGVDSLDTIEENKLYHLTKENGSIKPKEDNSIQITGNVVENIVYGVKNSSLVQVRDIVEYPFVSNNLQVNSNFDILGEDGSRCCYVVNNDCKVIKIGIIHVTNFRSEGVIDRNYTFDLIVNNVNKEQFFTIEYNDENPLRSLSQDISNLNIFLKEGDCIGLRYVPTGDDNTGNYCEVRLTCDLNAS